MEFYNNETDIDFQTLLSDTGITLVSFITLNRIEFIVVINVYILYIFLSQRKTCYTIRI